MIFTTTNRLSLRNIEPKDTEIMHDYRNNDICARYQRGQTKDLEGIQKLIEEHSYDKLTVEAPCIVAVAKKDTDELVGEIVVMPNEGTISLGYTFAYQHHRKGYAYEALSVLIDLLHNQHPQWDFICFTEKENIASMNLLEKLGYKNMGYADSVESQVFGKWTTQETEEEIAQVVGK